MTYNKNFSKFNKAILIEERQAKNNSKLDNRYELIKQAAEKIQNAD
ncbi:Hypothetical protein DAL_153 [Psychrobacter phage D'Alembert]|nr:Hypothetical protein DAL_10 [Psychrobacter phage D'Alembert]CAH1193562.1 Hypothetical protein DAL_153 [Psychrobacter phage D'Alembert]